MSEKRWRYALNGIESSTAVVDCSQLRLAGGCCRGIGWVHQSGRFVGGGGGGGGGGEMQMPFNNAVLEIVPSTPLPVPNQEFLWNFINVLKTLAVVGE